jgi:hypothetical protein
MGGDWKLLLAVLAMAVVYIVSRVVSERFRRRR